MGHFLILIIFTFLLSAVNMGLSETEKKQVKKLFWSKKGVLLCSLSTVVSDNQ